MVAKLIGFILIGAAIAVYAYQYNQKFLDWLRFQSIGTRDYIVDRLATMFIVVDPNYVLLGQFCLSVIPALILFLLLMPYYIPGGVLAAIIIFAGWKAPKYIIDYIYNKRVEKFTLQMVDGLGLMSNGLKSGLSVIQSMSLVIQEMPNPMKQEFSLILSENKLGVTLEESFNNLARRIESDDVEMFVTSVNILKETGGNLAETFDTITYTLRERIKLQQKISSMTAQGFYQGVILMCVTPLLGIFFYNSDPEFMKPMFTHPVGWGILFVIAMLEVLGAVMIMKIIKVDV